MPAVLLAVVNPARANWLDVDSHRARTLVVEGHRTALARLWRARDDVHVQAGLQSKDPLVRAHAEWIQASNELRSGDVERALARRSALGWIRRAWTAPAGDRVIAPAEIDVSPDRWRPLDASVPSGAFRPAVALANDERSAFLLLVIDNPRAQRAKVRIGSSGEARCSIAGAPWIELVPRAEAALDQESFATALEAGLNPILFHLAGEPKPGEVIVRIVGDDESRPPGLTTTSSRAAREASMARAAGHERVETAPQPLPPVTADLDGRRALPAVALRAILAAELALDDRRALPGRSERELRVVVEERSEWVEGWLRLGRCSSLRDGSQARFLFERALQIDPTAAEAHVGLGELAQRVGRPLAARAAYDRAIAAAPSSARAWARRSALGFDELGERAFALERLMSSPVADHPEVAAEAARIHLALGNPRGAARVARAGLSSDWTHALLRRAAFEAAVRASDLERALVLAESSIALEPDRLRGYLEVARLAAHRDPDRAQARLAEARARFPTAPEPDEVAAELAWVHGDPVAFEHHLRRARMLAADRRPRARAAPRSSSRGAPTEADRLAHRLMARAPSVSERAHGAAVLGDHRQIELRDDGSWTREIHRLVRVGRPNRHPELSRERIGYAATRETVKILEARRWSADGNAHAAESVEDSGPSGEIGGMYVDLQHRTVDFGRVEPGDVLELRYRVQSFEPNPLDDFFGAIEPVHDRIPVQTFELVAVSPLEQPLFSAQRNLPAPRVEMSDAERRATWRASDIDALVSEPLSPPYTERGSFISLSTWNEWSDLSAWYANLVRPQLRLDRETARAGRAATEGLEDPANIVRALAEHVTESIRYVGIELGVHGFKPFPAHQVFRRRYGDCKDQSALLIALLAEHGIEASFVLVRTADRGPFPHDAVNLWAFNHAITYVPSLDVYIDPTSDFGDALSLPPEVQGSMALVIGREGHHRLGTLPRGRPRDHAERARYQARISLDGTLELEGSESYRGALAADVREVLGSESRPGRLENLLRNRLPGLELETASFEGWDGGESAPSHRIRARVPRYATPHDGRSTVAVSLFAPDLTQRLATSTHRKTSVRMPHPWRVVHRVSYHIPADARIETLPEGQDVDTPWIALRQRIERTSNGWTVDDVVTVKTGRVDLEDYTAFRSACQTIDRAMRRMVVIRWN